MKFSAYDTYEAIGHSVTYNRSPIEDLETHGYSGHGKYHSCNIAHSRLGVMKDFFSCSFNHELMLWVVDVLSFCCFVCMYIHLL